MSNDNIANKYNQFQNDFGTKVKQDYNALIESLFTENFQKIINGQVYVSERAGLLKQLTELNQAVEGWTVEEIGIIQAADNHNYIRPLHESLAFSLMQKSIF